jgi:hypothetical protein
MKEGKNLVRIFSGSEVSVTLLKAEFEEIGIPAIIQNDFQSGISAGFSGGVPSAIDLYLQESDLEQAEPILNEFIHNANK